MEENDSTRVKRSNRYRHGHNPKSGPSGTYKSWLGMVYRGSGNGTAITRASYRDRGIVVCARWRLFDHFLDDMGCRPEGTSLDRIDNDGDYEPGNCRWATATQQARNKRNNRHITHGGETLTCSGWEERTGIKSATIRARLDAGWSAAKTLATPTTSLLLVEYRGRHQRVDDWAREYGVSRSTLYRRLKGGMPIGEALGQD